MHRELNLNVKKQLSNLNFPIVDVYDIFYKKSVEEKMQKQRFTILRLVLVAGLVWILIQLAGVAVGDTVSGAEASGRSWAGITAFLFAYLLGVGVSFTPCVWPMYPITSSIIMGTSSAKSTKRGFALSLIYVLGLALTYSVIGLLSGFFGAKVRLILQNAWIILFVAAVFIIFGLSMLGLFEIRMPASITSRLMKGKRKGIVGIFLMGLVSGIIASPCGRLTGGIRGKDRRRLSRVLVVLRICAGDGDNPRGDRNGIGCA